MHAADARDRGRKSSSATSGDEVQGLDASDAKLERSPLAV